MDLKELKRLKKEVEEWNSLDCSSIAGYELSGDTLLELIVQLEDETKKRKIAEKNYKNLCEKTVNNSENRGQT